jgi:phosphotransferase system HPr-like phosphotransfer protein
MEMCSYKVKFNNVNEIIFLNRIASKYDNYIDVKDGHIIIDAKSIMGLFGLDFTKDLEIVIHSYGDNDKKLIDDMKPLIAQISI